MLKPAYKLYEKKRSQEVLNSSHIEKVNWPVNISTEHKKYFKPHVEYGFSNPKVENHFFIFIYRKGYCTNLLLKPLKISEPWHNYYQKFTKLFFLGNILTAIKKRKIKLVFTPIYYNCINEFSDNYFHWLTEVLPKMTYVKSRVGPAAKFYIPFKLSDYQLASLKLLEINFEAASRDIAFFFRLKAVGNFTEYPGYYHPELLHKTQRLLKVSTSDNRIKGRKIYVTRKNASRRRIFNEEKLQQVLLENGFEIFDFDTIKFLDQIEILAETSIFVSQHGAALTNMIFMKPGSAVIEFLPKELVVDKCYFTLAGTLKHAYFYLFCETDGPHYLDSDFLVNPKELQSILNKISVSDPGLC